jgi:hypothetical protein
MDSHLVSPPFRRRSRNCRAGHVPGAATGGDSPRPPRLARRRTVQLNRHQQHRVRPRVVRGRSGSRRCPSPLFPLSRGLGAGPGLSWRGRRYEPPRRRRRRSRAPRVSWPAASIRSPVMVLIPRIGRSRRFSCAWSASTRLFAYRSTSCHAPGLNASKGHHRARSPQPLSSASGTEQPAAVSGAGLSGLLMRFAQVARFRCRRGGVGWQ